MNSPLFGVLLQIGIPVFLIVLAWFTGRAAERSHFRNLAMREDSLSDMVLSDLKGFPLGADPDKGGTLVMGQVVIASDYLKTFLSAIRKIFGGELKSYETLMERARREALLRMQEEAHKAGYDAVGNIRLSFSNIGSMSKNKGGAMVEVIAWGTAYQTRRERAI